MTDDDLHRVAAVAMSRAEEMRGKRPDWCSELLAICLVQGAARHRQRGDRGVKDFDSYLFFARPSVERDSQGFPFNQAGVSRDFGPSPHGRQLYTDADRSDPKIRSRVPRWERFEGRRVDVLARAIDKLDTPRDSIVAWLARGEGSAAFLARTPVIALAPDFGEEWWSGPNDDPLGVAKGAYAG